MAESLQDLAQVVSGSAKDGIHGIAYGTFEEVATEATVSLHMSDHRFNGITSLKPFFNQVGHASFGSGYSHRQALRPMPLVAAIDECLFGCDASQVDRLLDGRFERVPVIRIAWQ